jgi:hypothetical protein
MGCDQTDLAMLATAFRTYLRTTPDGRRQIEDYIDWLTNRLVEQAAAPSSSTRVEREN